MSRAKELRKKVEGCELHHAALKEHLLYFNRRIDDALEGFESRIDWLVGPTRAGKSVLFQALARAHPEVKLHDRREVPVLYVEFPSNISTKSLPKSVLQALGVRPGGTTFDDMNSQMFKQLKLAKTRVVLFDEASHLVEIGAKVPPRTAADWFKTLREKSKVTLLLSGLPRLERLLNSNVQLMLRASTRRELRPFDARVPDERAAFSSCVRTYSDLFSEHGWPIEVEPSKLVAQCYLFSGGLIGILSALMKELACQIADQAPRTLKWEDCLEASKIAAAAGHPDFPAFIKDEVSAIELTAAFSHVLQTNEMSVVGGSKVAGRTQ